MVDEQDCTGSGAVCSVKSMFAERGQEETITHDDTAGFLHAHGNVRFQWTEAFALLDN